MTFEIAALYVGFAVLAVLLLVALLQQRRDKKEHGLPTNRDRVKTLVAALVSLIVLLIICALSEIAFAAAILVIFVYSQIAAIGRGKHGLYRQLRDGSLLGGILSVLFCIAF